MPFSLFRAPEREPSQFVGFAGNRIETLSEARADDAVERALADPRARILIMKGGRLVLRVDETGFDCRFGIEDARAMACRFDRAVFLGRDEDGPVLAVPGGLEPDDLPAGIKAIDYRSVHAQGLLDAAGLGALAQGAALLAWHQTHRFCGRCGQPTEPRAGGYKRVCTNCGAQLFPRTDPVAIMLAVTPTHCLMGRSPHFAAGMYSCLAGFIEPGETIENAVRRETREEAGILIGRVAYHASQPWPFPHSLMIGCFGEALSTEIVRDDELEDCRWFSRAETRAVLEGHGEGITVPPPVAIATHLIHAWAISD